MKKGKILGILAVLLIIVIVFIVTFDRGNLLRSMTGQSSQSIKEIATVTKVIDGDTFIAGGESVRMLGVDADEKGYPCYYAAKERLEELVLGKEVYLEKGEEDRDIYDRKLRYMLFNGENINLRLVKEGYVIARTEDGDVYRQEFIDAENFARENRIGCKWSNNTWLPGSNIQDQGTWSRLIGEAVQACNAGNFVGQEKLVQGKVVDVYKSSSSTTFINFEKPYPNSCFTAVIFKSDLGKFNDPEHYINKLVRVKGKIKSYQGKVEIVLENEDMIEASG